MKGTERERERLKFWNALCLCLSPLHHLISSFAFSDLKYYYTHQQQISTSSQNSWKKKNFHFFHTRKKVAYRKKMKKKSSRNQMPWCLFLIVSLCFLLHLFSFSLSVFFCCCFLLRLLLAGAYGHVVFDVSETEAILIYIYFFSLSYFVYA